MTAGIPTARSVDHTAATVPDVEEAVACLVDGSGPSAAPAPSLR